MEKKESKFGYLIFIIHFLQKKKKGVIVFNIITFFLVKKKIALVIPRCPPKEAICRYREPFRAIPVARIKTDGTSQPCYMWD